MYSLIFYIRQLSLKNTLKVIALLFECLFVLLIVKQLSLILYFDKSRNLNNSDNFETIASPAIIRKFNYSILLKFNPFYFKNSLPLHESKSRSADVATVILNGIRYRENGKSSAIIKYQEKQNLFFEGEKIATNLNVGKIYQNSIEIVTLSEKKIISLRPLSSNGNTLLYNHIVTELDYPLFSEANYLLKSEIQEAFQEISILPYSLANSRAGLEVIGSKSDDLLEKLSLQQGDVLYDPKGGDLISYDDLFELIDNFENTGKLELVVFRPSIRLQFTLYIG